MSPAWMYWEWEIGLQAVDFPGVTRDSGDIGLMRRRTPLRFPPLID